MFPLVHHPDYLIDAGSARHFRWNKYSALIDMLRGAAAPPNEHIPEPMPIAWLEAVHDCEWVAAVLAARVDRARERRIGFPVTPALAMRAQRTCGGTYLAALLALDHGYAANSAGGSHHALRDSGAGYCIFNDLAVTAHRLLAEGRVQRILVVDLDVHQGDGTASIFAGRRDVFTFSVHAERNFPVRKAASGLDVALPDGLGDADYLSILEGHLSDVVSSVRPDLILYQAGVDVHADDTLGRLSISDDGLMMRDAMVGLAARSRGIPIASVVGGGYGPDPLPIARRHAQTMVTLAHCCLT